MITPNKKYGCLTVLDLGEEYPLTERYLNSLKQKGELLTENESLLKIQYTGNTDDKIAKINEKPSSSFALNLLMNPNVNIEQLFNNLVQFFIQINNDKIEYLNQLLNTHYKCQCKCGKIHYYNEKTIESNPKYCFYPTQLTKKYSKTNMEKFVLCHELENVIPCEKEKCIPSPQFCERYNAHKTKQLEKVNIELSKIPRKLAKNYEHDFTGEQYESLYIIECINEHFESEPSSYFDSNHRKHWHDIIVYKQYKCICELCGKEHLIKCDQFGIYPPTAYGYRAYDGYWSEVKCDCHKISSFQWIVNKLLIENNVKYKVEYRFQELYGVDKVNLLRFDFAILNDDGTLKCLIECQGEQHFKPVDEFGGNQTYKKQTENDNLKRKFVKNNNIKLIEISYKDKKYEKVEKILKNNNII